MIVREALIPMPDGVRLAATIYLPDGTAEPAEPVRPGAGRPAGRVPALLEYLPYRKDDAMLLSDYQMYADMTGRGYAGARVDIRGTGRSGGDLPPGEYSEQEQRDAVQVIDWLARQPWCSGSVGMWGISWGGFNSIQVAVRRPPALRAIIAVAASDDLFHDDVHYLDGLLHLDEYALMIDQLNALPPAPEYPLDEETLGRRFDREPWLASWLAQQRDGPYWRRASLRPDYSRLAVPAFLTGGWYDGYRDSIPRMLASVPAPVKALIGPWNHIFPHDGEYGPLIEWRAEAARWWDHWLKGIDTGIMAEPPVTLYVQRWHPPDLGLTELPGHWRAEDGLPPQRARQQTWYCGPDRTLAAEPPAGGEALLRYLPSAGVEAGNWWGELTPDQRGADAFSLAFDSAPLAEDLEILGFPRVEIDGGADAGPLNWFARLCDVAPDGTVTLVTGAGRGAGYDPLRDPPWPAPSADPAGSASAAEVAAGPGHTGEGAAGPARTGEVAAGPPSAAQAARSATRAVRPLDLHVTSWVFPRGHRIRLSLSNAMWPMIWPTPRPATATYWFGPAGTRLVLPVIPAAPAGPEFVPEFADPAPAQSPPGVAGSGDRVPVRWTFTRDEQGSCAISWRGWASTQFPWGRVADEEYLRYQVADDRPAEASAHGEARTEIQLADRVLVFSSVLDLTGDEAALRYSYRRELRRDGLLIRERSWQRTFPRDGH